MTSIFDQTRAEYAVILEKNLKEVADELRAIDVFDMISFVQAESYPAIEDLLQSSTELFFREGTLTFAWSAGAEVTWENPPAVKLGMEFRNDGIAVFFDLLIGAYSQNVTIGGIFFDSLETEHPAGPLVLARALATARLPLREASR